jgi:low affinity Fe/Cu permease
MVDEKDEKFDEKDMEKREEKSPEEKSWDEKYKRDPLGSIVWAVILIWAGLVFLASNLGWLEGLIRRSSDIPGMGWLSAWMDAWPIVLIGAGVIILVEVVIRLLVPAYRRPVTGSIILAIILIGLALGDLVSWDLIWPVILIVLGVSVLMRGLWRKS